MFVCMSAHTKHVCGSQRTFGVGLHTPPWLKPKSFDVYSCFQQASWHVTFWVQFTSSTQVTVAQQGLQMFAAVPVSLYGFWGFELRPSWFIFNSTGFKHDPLMDNKRSLPFSVSVLDKSCHIWVSSVCIPRLDNTWPTSLSLCGVLSSGVWRLQSQASVTVLFPLHHVGVPIFSCLQLCLV